jgi:hypothetical protein
MLRPDVTVAVIPVSYRTFLQDPPTVPPCAPCEHVAQEGVLGGGPGIPEQYPRIVLEHYGEWDLRDQGRPSSHQSPLCRNMVQ